MQVSSGDERPFVYACTYSYGQNTGAQQSNNENVTRNKIFGLTTNSTKSGIIADVTSITIPAKQLGKFYIRF